MAGVLVNKHKVTSFDVARVAGVSRSTVSLVLSGSNAVIIAEATKVRVREAAIQLGYTPNSAGRMLASGATKTIGLIISNPELLLVDGFIPPTLYAITKVANEHGYNVLTEGLPDLNNDSAFVDLVSSRRIDGMIVLNPRTHDRQLEALIERNYPVVLMGTINHPKEITVNIPTVADLTQAVNYLYKLGHRKIGHVALSAGGSSATDYRIRVIRLALQKHKLELPEACITYANFSAESGLVAGRELLTRNNGVTAVLAGNDTIAIGLMRAARDLGKRLPEDMSIIGYDDLPLAAYIEPPLTTIRTEPLIQGEIAARLLIDILQGRPLVSRAVDLKSKFIVRGSCKAV
jgi:DNA-binding LacI/PurR family transcriptional regulator